MMLITQKEFDSTRDRTKFYEATQIGIIYKSLGVVLVIKDKNNTGKSLSKEEYPEYFL